MAPLITGFVVQATGSFTPALLVAGAIALAPAMGIWSGEAIFGQTLVRRVP